MVKLSVVIPVYNEEKTVKIVLDKIKRLKLKNVRKELVIVDNASTDNTPNILRRYKGKDVKIIRHEKNLGKGTSVRTGIKHSTGDIILIQDADLEYNPEEYPKLLKPIFENNAKVVYGSRTIGRKRASYAKLVYYLGGLSLTMIPGILYGIKVSDACCGYKVFRSEVIKPIKLKCKQFEFDCEVTAKILKRGIKIYEIPVSYSPRSRKEGKKIKFSDWLRSVYVLLKYRFID